MAVERMPITPAVLTWARERAGYTIAELIHRTHLPRILDWETGWDAPTYHDLEKVADQLEVPVAVFFFPEPPKLPMLERKFRMRGSDILYGLSPRIQFLMQEAEYHQRQCAKLRDYLHQRIPTIVNDIRFSVDEAPETLASVVREYLDVSIDEQFNWARKSEAYENWRNKLFSVGVSVIHQEFRQDDYLSYALHDKRFPIISVNKSIQWREGLTTIFHSLSHLLFQTSGFNIRDDSFVGQLAPENRQIETMCNHVSSEIVVPQHDLAREFVNWQSSGNLANKVSELAFLFGVHEKWLNKRLLTLDLLTKKEYSEILDIWAARPAIGGGGGGHRFSAILSNLGAPYVNLVLDCLDADLIDNDSLADYLDIAPPDITELRKALESESL